MPYGIINNHGTKEIFLYYEMSIQINPIKQVINPPIAILLVYAIVWTSFE